MDSSSGDQNNSPNRPQHFSEEGGAESSSGVGSRRRRSSLHHNNGTSNIAMRPQHPSAHRIDPYKTGGTAALSSRRNSGTHQGSYPTSARYYASSAASSQTTNGGHQVKKTSNFSTHSFHHPLQHQVLPSSTYNSSTRSSRVQYGHHDMLSHPHGLTAAVRYTLKLQARKVAESFVSSPKGRRSKRRSKRKDVLFNRRRILELSQMLIILLIPIVLSVFVAKKIKHYVPPILDRATKPNDFKWKPNRRLNNRQCTLNMFIEKQAPDEFNPDFEEIKPGEKNKDGTPKVPEAPKFAPGGTYRTKGQVSVIQRFISSVADSFRPQAGLQQHLVFTGTRDGGHLAELALKFWPARGEFMTQLYIISDDTEDHSVHNNTNSTDFHRHLIDNLNENEALDYGSLSSIEERFQNHKLSDQVHLFDSNGHRAGLIRNDLDDDDVVQLMQEQMFDIDDDAALSVDIYDDDIVYHHHNASGKGEAPKYFSLKKLLSPFLELDEDDPNSLTRNRDPKDAKNKTKHVIPYLHVDGLAAEQKFEILQSAKPLLLDNTVVTVGVENSPDLKPIELIDFFRTVNYKTFILGKRQIMRVDHLCPEILDQLINHPSIHKSNLHWFRRFLQKFGIISQEKDAHIVHPHPRNVIQFPAFFVAFPRGRHSMEEMTIQHMYDLFGGGGGGGQVATANDRKAPGKKKKKK